MIEPIERPPPLPLVLAQKARQNGHHVLATFDGGPLTYGSLYDQAQRLAAALAARGVGKGMPVILMLGNGPEILISLFALAYAGALAVPTNPALKGQSLAHVFATTGAVTVITEQQFLPRIQEALQESSPLNLLIIAGGPDGGKQSGAENFADLLAEHSPALAVQMDRADPWMVLFTSGTTGVSKGVTLSHQQLASTSWDVMRSLALDKRSIFYTFYPLFHLNAIVFGPLACLLADAHTIVRREFPREKLLDDLRSSKATHWAALPFLLRGLLSQTADGRAAGLSLKMITCIGVTTDEVEMFERRFGAQLVSGYGATESAMVGVPAPARLCTAGRLNPRHQLRVVDPAGHDVATGQVGEFWIKTHDPLDRMLGYYNMPDATAAAFHDGWFKTGDLGWQDQQGYLHFTDRVKESLKRRGENVSTFEVETVLQKYPGVAGAAVVGYRPPEGGDEEVRAFLELMPGVPPLDWAALVRHCNRHLAYFMVPRYFDVGIILPRTALGKIEKHKLKTYPLADTTFDVKASGILIER